MINENPDETTTEEAPTAEIIEDPKDELEEDFDKFEQNSSNHTVEQNDTQQEEEGSPEIDLSDAENFKLQIFLSLMFGLLDGLHGFIYKFITKYKLSREDIALDESDKAGLEIYFKTKKVMDLINRLPVEVIGFLHIEYMYFNKFQDFNKRQKELEEQEEEEKEEEQKETAEDIEKRLEQKFAELQKKFEEREKKPLVKKAAAKKKPVKKAAAKKQPEAKK